MTEYRDPFPELPLMVDLGGMKYYLGELKPVELAYKNRAEFKNTFGKDPRTEFILRKYMFPDLVSKRKLEFDSPAEKDELVKILEKRAAQLESSREFSSSTLKNTIFQQSYLNIQKLLQELKGTNYKPPSSKGFSLKMPDILACTKAKKYIKTIPEDRLFELILELSWMLLNPDKVPKDIQCSWAGLIKKLDTLRLGDIMAMIREEQEKKGIKTDQKPLNYLDKVDIKKVSKAPTIKNALDQVKSMALELQGANAKQGMEERLKTLLNILEVKKYLNNKLPVDDKRMKIIDTEQAGKISKSLITNPLSGGGATLDKPLGIAMAPLFDYFKVVYDPMYSFLESSITSYTKGEAGKVRTVMIPSLLTLLHLCNNINRSVPDGSKRDLYGVYRILNVDDSIMSFINNVLDSTITKLDGIPDKTEKFGFNKQIMELPKVRLSTLLNKFASNAYKDPETIPFVQFFTVGKNLMIPPKDKFLNPAKPELTEKVYDEMVSFFNPKDLYIVYTKKDNISENIPMNMYQVDLNSVDVAETAIKFNNLDDNYFNTTKTPELFLDQLVSLKEYVMFNDSELALSIFIAFKELMPK
jgi:hypothetical protein